jgi:type II secretory ATPase GspE/PulE/Tfp pilus assembly ATPase PilB-like protein
MMTAKHPEPDPAALRLLEIAQMEYFGAIPYKMEAGSLWMFHPEGKIPDIRTLAVLTGKTIRLSPLDQGRFREWMDLVRGKEKASDIGIPHALDPEAADTVRRVSLILSAAVAAGSSDIHFERYANLCRVRFRIDGQMIPKYSIPAAQFDGIVSRLKILGELDIGERRLPQDGRFRFGDTDIRISTLPGKTGEKVVLRLLGMDARLLKLSALGMNPAGLALYRQAIRMPNGIILITGPTGSGKTTTLYASLNVLNEPLRNILTVEDPVEYELEGIHQVQVRERIGLTFDRVLRAFLRQDPDIMMVGEIRDPATASIAIRAALTGHLVFSTLHTNSAAAAVVRLLDMGIPPYLLASSLRLVVAQRLIRTLCKSCSPAVEIQDDSPKQAHCPKCRQTGYSGRKAIYEFLEPDPEVRELIRGSRFSETRYASLRPDISRLQDSVMEMVKRGETSREEAEAVLGKAEF